MTLERQSLMSNLSPPSIIIWHVTSESGSRSSHFSDTKKRWFGKLLLGRGHSSIEGFEKSPLIFLRRVNIHCFKPTEATRLVRCFFYMAKASFH
ncbi:hypothetical protein HZ326_6074 [Fusarium oxysporum f. sp. albedinis]|nr:hypothetical protein HZ326_6074 [Fusarium oxysporum f. sp. albedinis]